ncbi:UNVERIFIED_CONTAM: hypothetical protein PYX00_003460 [Menopon gallinae]|uniref:C2H2-type domain-containing protein n=1 Tax=Menopon gallinae TaxID=328185 RepID=A0AAW2I169_9NEOP
MKMVPKNFSKSSKSNRTNGSKEKNTASLDNEEKSDEDRSILRQPMDIGIRGVKDLMKALAGGTTELQDLLLNECSVIYECKICCNLFRSLANFISHKRVYCVKSFCYFTDSVNKLQNENEMQSIKNNEVTVIPDMPSQNEQCVNDTDAWVTSDKTCNDSNVVIDGLQNLAPRKKLDPVKLTKKRDITEIVAGLSRRERVMMRRNARQKTVVELENVNDSSSSVFQTLKGHDYNCSVDSMKIQLIELDRVVSKNQAILQENGKFMVTSQNNETEEEKNLEKHNCSVCDSSFLTEQTLSRHVQIYHRERICYPCPLCRTFFASPSSVYRHLSKAHHRTEQQIRRLRPQVFSKARKRKLLQASPKVIANSHDDPRKSKREADDWINNFEGALRCISCGKLFNRRAVLSVHSAACRKRAALLNSSTNQPTNKVKNTSQTLKPPVKVIPIRNSKPVIPKQLPKSGILVRKDYCKTINTVEKPLNSSLLTEADKDCSWEAKSWKPINRVESYLTDLHGDVNAKCNSSDKLSSSSDSNSVLLNSSTKKSTINKKSNSLGKVESIKKSIEKSTNKNFQVTPMQVQDISVKN